MKIGFIMSESHYVLQSYADNKGADFRVLNRVGESQFDILCKQINIEKTTYAFIPKKDLEQGLREDLYIGLVLFIDNEKPRKYLISSTVWSNPNPAIFCGTDSVRSEYGINIHKDTFPELVQYAFEKQITKV
jgi:hypothetical protein